MNQCNYIQIAMMKRYGKTQTVFQDRRLHRSGEKVNWELEFFEVKDCETDDDWDDEGDATYL